MSDFWQGVLIGIAACLFARFVWAMSSLGDPETGAGSRIEYGDK